MQMEVMEDSVKEAINEIDREAVGENEQAAIPIEERGGEVLE